MRLSTIVASLMMWFTTAVLSQDARQLGVTEESLGEYAYQHELFTQALPHFLAAAQAGNKDAFSYLGYMYRLGRGVSIDLKEAEKWFDKSVLAGNVIDKPALDGVRRLLTEEAQQRVAEQQRSIASTTSAQENEHLGEFAYQQELFTQALPHFLAAAQAGNKYAFSYLGYMYRLGRGVPIDLKEAEKWFDKSVLAGNISDKGSLDGVRQLLAKEAAQQRIDEQRKLIGPAERNMGELAYQQELFTQALPHFLAAAQVGDKDAFSYLGYMYRLGRGVPTDLKEAEKWFDKSVAAGNTLDKDALDGVRRLLAEEIQQRVAEQQRQQTVSTKVAVDSTPSPAPQTQSDNEDDSDRQSKISQLRSDIESQNQFAENDEDSANQLLNNCSGPGATICRALGQAGAARLRQKAAEARNQADSDQEEIERLQGEEVQSVQRRDTSYGGNLQQVATENGTNIQNAAAQQQANLQATAAAIQQRQQAEVQARLTAQNSQPPQVTNKPPLRPSSSNVSTTTSSTNIASSSTSTNNAYNPYNATPTSGSYNPYTGTGSGSIQGSCTNMTASVYGTAKVGSDGWVIGSLTNNSNQPLYVAYTFKQNGVPSTAMANGGGTTIQAGQTVGGEGQGLYSTGADKNPPQIYWYAVLKSEHDKYGCVHKW